MTATLEVELRGAPLQLLEDVLSYQGEPAILEYLLDGPGGTGKSRGICHVLQVLGDVYPEIRVLVVRKTRASLTESFCKTWEQDVLPPGDPMLSGPQRTHRHSYKHPNGTEYVLGGLDVDSRLFSTDYDVVYIQEVFEIGKDEFEKFRRALRNFNGPRRGKPGAIPFQLLVADTNPHVPWHWVNKHPWGKRLLSRHYENPALYNADTGTWTPQGKAYLGSLQRLTGVRRDRLYHGKWVAAEGMVWPEYDEATHLVARSKVPELRWYFGAVDWGFTDPGVFQVWGVDTTGRMYRVAEIYRTAENLDWWAARACDLHKQYELRAIVCDPSRPDAISLFNDRLGSREKDPLERIARPANNKKTTTGSGDLGGLDCVRQRLASRTLYYVRDATLHPDEGLRERAQPTCAEQEIQGYVYAKRQFTTLSAAPDARAVDLTDPSVPDHAMDTTRYAAVFADGRDLSDPPPKKQYPPGSYGRLYGHDIDEDPNG